MKTLDIRNIPEERLSTTDEKGRRLYIHPADVRGRFQKARVFVHGFLILFFLILPWLSIHGNPILLLDIAHRHFVFLGTSFWAHDAPTLLFIFLGAALTLALATTLWGRIWCGWACPQTVFIENVFRRIERWIEGDSIDRRNLEKSNWNTEKYFKKISKWSLFLLVSLVLTHSFLAYFIPKQILWKMIQSSPIENPGAFLVMICSSALVLFDFGWFREQFCTIVCPYGRFQSVLMDEHSLFIAYDAKRGEPRRAKETPKYQEGDCINCYRCVDVCPTGIDIRRGLQMECIACTACIDACDEVMLKLAKPRGLIRYDSAQGLQGKVKKLIGLRGWIYFILLLFAISAFILNVSNRTALELTVVRSKEAPYQILNSGQASEVANHFKLDLVNQGSSILDLYFELEKDEHKEDNSDVQLIIPAQPLRLEPGQNVRTDLFIRFPANILKEGHAEIEMNILSNLSKDFQKKEKITLVGPIL